MNPKDQWQLIEQAERYADGRLSEAEATDLDQRLKTDAEARRVFAEALHLGAELRHEGSSAMTSAAPASSGAASRPAAAMWWRYAAAVVLSLGIGMWMSPRPRPQHMVATLVKAKQCQWAGSTLPTVEGARLPAGTLDLIEGLATLKFDSGAEVVMEAPATIEVLDAMNCQLKRGTVVADVPPSAKGFTIDTAQAKVVDWGTRFGVSAGDDGNYMVQVLEGRVDVNHKGTPEVKQLHKGQTMDHGWYKSRLNPEASLDGEPNRWQPNVILDGGDGWQVISTAFGRGKDSYTQAGQKNRRDNGSDPFFRVKYSSNSPDLTRKGYVAFDLSKFAGHKFTDAEFVLTIEPSDLGFASVVPDSSFQVYGLTDESEDAWEENGLTWEHSPAQDPAKPVQNLPMLEKARLLGQFEIAQGVSRGTRSIRGAALRDFLNADTNGIVTFIICRETDETQRSGLVHAFATKENGGKNAPPLLRVK